MLVTAPTVPFRATQHAPFPFPLPPPPPPDKPQHVDNLRTPAVTHFRFADLESDNPNLPGLYRMELLRLVDNRATLQIRSASNGRSSTTYTVHCRRVPGGR